MSICLSFRRYLALCVGETRVRFDLQVPLKPLMKKNHGKRSGKISVSPTKLRFLSQVSSGFFSVYLSFSYTCTLPVISNCFFLPFQLLSFHISSVNVMVLNIAHSESLWHMTVTGITLLLDHQCKR